MFDYTNVHSTQSIKINAVTGSILKNHPKSWFEQFSLKSGEPSNFFIQTVTLLKRGYTKNLYIAALIPMTASDWLTTPKIISSFYR